MTFTIFGRRYRLAIYYGPPPGSHNGFWVTNWPPIYGWNLRFGPYRHSITLLAHTWLVRKS